MNIIKKLKTKGLRISMAEMYFPPELYTIIEDLKKQDDLNQENLDRLINHINHHFFLFFTLALMASALLLEGFYFIVLAAFWWWFLFWGLKKIFHKEINKFVHLYNYGSFTAGRYEYCGVGGMYSQPKAFRIKINFELNNILKTSVLKGAASPTLIQKVEKGAPAIVVYNPDNADENLPFIKAFADVYYLRKTEPDIIS